MDGGAALGGDSVDVSLAGREEDANDGGVAFEDGRVQGRRVEEAVAANLRGVNFMAKAWNHNSEGW